MMTQLQDLDVDQEEEVSQEEKINLVWNKMWQYAQTFTLSNEQWWCM